MAAKCGSKCVNQSRLDIFLCSCTYASISHGLLFKAQRGILELWPLVVLHFVFETLCVCRGQASPRISALTAGAGIGMPSQLV